MPRGNAEFGVMKGFECDGIETKDFSDNIEVKLPGYSSAKRTAELMGRGALSGAGGGAVMGGIGGAVADKEDRWEGAKRGAVAGAGIGAAGSAGMNYALRKDLKAMAARGRAFQRAAAKGTANDDTTRNMDKMLDKTVKTGKKLIPAAVGVNVATGAGGYYAGKPSKNTEEKGFGFTGDDLNEQF